MQDLLADLLAHAARAGADAADVVHMGGASLSVQVRHGKTEQVERAEGRDLGLRVFIGNRSAMVSTTAQDPAGFAELAARAVAMARVVPQDPYGGLCDQAAMLPPPALDMVDAAEPDSPALIARAMAAEDAARSVAGVTNTEGATAGYSRVEIALATSAGFAGMYTRTSHAISATALAGTGTDMQRDYDSSGAVHLADLDDATAIGLSAGRRAIARLNPVRPRTGRFPVVFDPRVAGSLLGHLSGAINGASVARGTTFLKDRMGQAIFAPGVTIIDDPRRLRGLRTRPFDGEGVPTAARAIIDNGVLQTWLLDSRSARQLGLTTTGHASRGTSGPPSPAPTNFYLQAGTFSPAELMADITEGLYVTELIGMGVNGITGDYSRGMAGFMIRNGQLAEPVAEATIAGSLPEMFAQLIPANDLRFRRAVDAPTVRVGVLTVAGA